MATAPIITFKAGQCDLDTSSKPFKVKPQAQPGYIYLYSEDDLIHFCWRRRDAPLTDPELDLVMVPTDGSFVPYEYKTSPQPTAKTNGRIFALKFASSSQRHLFWLQSKPQSQNGDESWFSPRDRKIGEIVNSLLQGEEVDVTRELANVRRSNNQPDDDDDDEDMEDAEPSLGPRGSVGGGAGADATGGDVREEGESSREGGADGARAGPAGNSDASEAVRNLLSSLAGQPGLSGSQSQTQDKPYPHLSHLLPTSTTVPMVDYIASNNPARLDTFLGFLPPSVLVLSGPNPEAFSGKDEPAAAEVEKAKAAMSLEDKKALLKKVLRSPQFFQALGVLSQALRDGGLPGVADALGIRVENGGYLPNGTMPLGGGQAIEAFVEGVKKTVGGQ